MIKYIQGDLLESNCRVIAHGVNCSGGFASGVAGQIAKKWPEVKSWYFRKGRWRLGMVQYVETDDNIVANCATQERYGKMAQYGVVYVDYPAVERVMRDLYDYVSQYDLTVAIPKIGAGLAGGDWNVIEKIINDVFHDREICVYIKA